MIIGDYVYDYQTANNEDRTLVQARRSPTSTSIFSTPDIDYTYDSLNRLTEADERHDGVGSDMSYTWSYAYDDAGNIINKYLTRAGITGSPGLNFYYNDSNQLTRQHPPGTVVQYYLTYDDNGNETSNDTIASTWTARNQLASRDGTTFTYRGESNQILTNHGATTIEISPIGVTGYTIGSTKHRLTLLPDGTPIARAYGAARLYFMTDNIGSVVALTTALGGRSGTYQYDPYGTLTNASSLETHAANNPIRYAGGMHINNTSQYKFGARYYDPSIGRFTQMDPSGQEDNPYAYAANNPINYTDDSGMSACSEAVFWTALGAIGFATAASALFGLTAAATLATGLRRRQASVPLPRLSWGRFPVLGIANVSQYPLFDGDVGVPYYHLDGSAYRGDRL